ncbi:MAG TPA: SMC family ATPase [Acidimicrobiales bacterium]|nr:SMC family ATPase [Acidimicrobiales bacterium]
MRVTRIHLRNYRVYEDDLELEVPPGLVGVYGLNGAGKSALIESIRFALYGKSRTQMDEVRTAGVNAECIAEVEFEHEGHLYLVRRTISGANSQVKAEAHADGQQVAEGVRDTSRYVHSILGMSDAAFRASVFAEQKQIAAFSEQTPGERRKLVLQLLGITPLDSARDLARKDAKSTQEQFQRLRSVLPDLDAVGQAVTTAEVAATEAEDRKADDEALAVVARADVEKAMARHQELDVLRQEHERLVAEGKAVREQYDKASAWVAKLTEEQADLERAAERLMLLVPEAEGWKAAEERLRLVEAVVAAQAGLAKVPQPVTPIVPDEAGAESARAQAEAAKVALATVNATIQAAKVERDRAAEAVKRSSVLTGEGDCPLCGQALGDAFEAVQAHRAAELAEIEARLNELELDHRQAVVAATTTGEHAAVLAKELRKAQEEWATHEKRVARRQEAEAALAAAEAALGRPLADGERAALAAEVDRRRQAKDECQRIQGRLERRQAVTAELDVEKAAMAESWGRLEALRDKVAGLGFNPEQLTVALAERVRLQAAAEAATLQAQRSAAAATQARERAQAEARRLAEVTEQHDLLAELGEEARHLARLGDLLNTFRNTLVASVGPRLSAQAAELFAELTDREYDRLEVDPDTYEIKILDAGRTYGMSRFSGSETDLANLALRVAVSEHVRFQSGGAVGLLVLDEVFGPLDDDRKARMLLALERLRARFRQVLVVTHDTAIKEQLPNAIEVRKLPGRRATARTLNA